MRTVFIPEAIAPSIPVSESSNTTQFFTIDFGRSLNVLAQTRYISGAGLLLITSGWSDPLVT